MALRFVVTCADGLEPLLRQELEALGAHIEISQRGAITVSGSLETAYRTCLWSRLATRVLLPLFEVDGATPEALYARARDFAWDRVFDLDRHFAVHATAGRGVKIHTQYIALKLKDAIVDYFRDKTGERPSVQPREADAPFHVFVEAERITVSYDLSGESLHRRGYRVVQTEAPLKESLAAAILLQAGWPEQKFPVLLDPMCGSGTFLIEAACMAADIAPGLLRGYYGFLGWKEHKPALWRELMAEAEERKQIGLQNKPALFLGFDASREALSAALKNAHAAGVSAWLELEQRELWQLRLPTEAQGQQGLLVTNPPYGERLGEADTVRYLYRALGHFMRERLPNWQAAVLCADIQHADALGVQHRATERLYNGAIPVFVRHGDVPAQVLLPLQFTAAGGELPAESQDFANRLQKNLKAALKDANREGVRCFRVYDADMPEFNLAVDVYEQWLHVQEYAPPKTIDPEKAAARFKLALQAIREVFGLHREKVFIKVRSRRVGKKQYEKQGSQAKFYEVQEGRARFLVNFTDYLDTGLFLDHRPLRLRMAAESAGKRFLNLFAYTGTATVQAALGGARSTTTVDLSPTYLLWAQRNLVLNGISEANHQFVQADCLAWMRNSRDMYDLIFIDPPTFSNSKRTPDVFDVQRDHVALIQAAMRRLSGKGTLYFSNNFRKFQLGNEALNEFLVEDISPETIDFDFQRNPKIHRCWRIQHKGS